MDLLQLEHFLAVVEERTFTRAAERVGRSQPAVSLSIKKLEEEVGMVRPRGDRSAEHALECRGAEGEPLEEESLGDQRRVHRSLLADASAPREATKRPVDRLRTVPWHDLHGMPCPSHVPAQWRSGWTAPVGPRHNRAFP